MRVCQHPCFWYHCRPVNSDPPLGASQVSDERPPLSGNLPARSPSVMFKEMEEGGVLFCTRAEAYFGLNPVSALIWKLLPDPGATGGDDLEHLLDRLQERFPDVHRDHLATNVREFLAELEKSELIVHAPEDED